jgi:hypothetical protein
MVGGMEGKLTVYKIVRRIVRIEGAVWNLSVSSISYERKRGGEVKSEVIE